MAKKKRKQKKSILRLMKESWFYRIYFTLLALCIAALTVGLGVLSGVMQEYEQTRPVHAAEEVLEVFNRHAWQEIHALDASAKKLKQETVDQYAQHMESLTAGQDFYLKNVLSIHEDEAKYNVMLGDKKFAELILEHSGETTKHNFALWQVKELETQAMASSEYTITVPADSTVQVNGLTLTDEDIIESGIATPAEGNLPEGVIAPTMVKYGVYMSFGEPENIVVTDKNGNHQEVTRDDDHSWSCDLAYDDASIKAKVEENVVKWGRRLAAYTFGDYDKIDLSNSCINPSPARTYIRNMENQWAAAHDGYDFQNMRTYDYYIYSDSCFSCKISFDYIVHYTKQDKSYPTNYTLYFAKDGGSFKLYSFSIA